MASSDKEPGPTPLTGGGGEGEEGATPPGQPTTMGSKLVDKGAKMLQSMKPVRQVQQHACSFALYAHDHTRQIETHLYVSRRNQNFLQCPVYDSDDPLARLIGVEYIVSENIFETLPPEEQKLWHSHAYEIKSGVWIHPRVAEMIAKPELKWLAKTYGKFWCTWQVDRGDRVPLGAPALMMSPQGVNAGAVRPDLLKSRDGKYKMCTEELRESRLEIEEPEWLNPNADYWKQHGKGFALDVMETDMKRMTPFP
ncbi:putative Oil body-associated protein [Dioscorea sansibarensis]